MASILLIDDEPELLAALATVLERSGHDVHPFADPRDLLAVLERADLLLTDIRMPHVDGRELLLRVRETRPDLPVIVMSGLVPADVPAHAFLLTKPFRTRVLLELVDRLVGHRAAPARDER